MLNRLLFELKPYNLSTLLFKLPTLSEPQFPQMENQDNHFKFK